MESVVSGEENEQDAGIFGEDDPSLEPEDPDAAPVENGDFGEDELQAVLEQNITVSPVIVWNADARQEFNDIISNTPLDTRWRDKLFERLAVEWRGDRRQQPLSHNVSIHLLAKEFGATVDRSCCDCLQATGWSCYYAIRKRLYLDRAPESSYWRRVTVAPTVRLGQSNEPGNASTSTPGGTELVPPSEAGGARYVVRNQTLDERMNTQLVSQSASESFAPFVPSTRRRGSSDADQTQHVYRYSHM